MTRRVTRQDFRLLLIFLRIRKCENCTCVPVTCVEENLLFCFSGVVFQGLLFWGCYSGVVILGLFFWGCFSGVREEQEKERSLEQE